jgi:hypothetical protein
LSIGTARDADLEYDPAEYPRVIQPILDRRADVVYASQSRFGFEPEITAKVAKRQCRVHEVGISYSGRTYSAGKKINWKDGVSALRCILKYNLR